MVQREAQKMVDIKGTETTENASPKWDFPSLNVEEIMEAIPHRPPMLLIDRLEELILGESAIGIKNVSINKWFFVGHFPRKPVMPGVLIVEAMAQTAGALVMKTLQAKDSGKDEKLVYFMSIGEARFRKPVIPGDTLHLKVQKHHHRGAVWKFRGTAFVGDNIVAEAIYTAMIVDQKPD